MQYVDLWKVIRTEPSLRPVGDVEGGQDSTKVGRLGSSYESWTNRHMTKISMGKLVWDRYKVGQRKFGKKLEEWPWTC